MNVNLQVALDVRTIDQAIWLARQVEAHVDWIEAGTPLIVGEGTKAIAKLKESFPEKVVVADLKIMDGGALLSEMGFSAGADVVTVLGHATEATVCRAVEQARRYGKKVLVDMLNVRDVAQRIRQVEALGVDYIGIHTGWDNPGLDEHVLHEFAVAAQVATLPRVVAGGINLNTIEAVLHTRPATVVVGTAITQAQDPAEAARLLKDRMKAVGLSQSYQAGSTRT